MNNDGGKEMRDEGLREAEEERRMLLDRRREGRRKESDR